MSSGKPRLVYTGPAANGGGGAGGSGGAAAGDAAAAAATPYSGAGGGAGGGQASVIVPFVTSYSSFVGSNGESLATLQPSSIKRTYPPVNPQKDHWAKSINIQMDEYENS